MLFLIMMVPSNIFQACSAVLALLKIKGAKLEKISFYNKNSPSLKIFLFGYFSINKILPILV